MTMKTEFNIINLRETMMVYPFSFSFFKSSPFVFSFCLLGGYKGGEAPIIAVYRTDSPHLLPPWEEIKERAKIITIPGIIFLTDAPSPS